MAFAISASASTVLDVASRYAPVGAWGPALVNHAPYAPYAGPYAAPYAPYAPLGYAVGTPHLGKDLLYNFRYYLICK